MALSKGSLLVLLVLLVAVPVQVAAAEEAVFSYERLLGLDCKETEKHVLSGPIVSSDRILITHVLFPMQDLTCESESETEPSRCPWVIIQDAAAISCASRGIDQFGRQHWCCAASGPGLSAIWGPEWKVQLERVPAFPPSHSSPDPSADPVPVNTLGIRVVDTRRNNNSNSNSTGERLGAEPLERASPTFRSSTARWKAGVAQFHEWITREILRQHARVLLLSFSISLLVASAVWFR